ncbi:hypothetical protein, partial [Vibrio splendidus]
APYVTSSFNRYSYVMNNPLKYTDPTGYYFSDSNGNGATGTCNTDGSETPDRSDNGHSKSQTTHETMTVYGHRTPEHDLDPNPNLGRGGDRSYSFSHQYQTELYGYTYTVNVYRGIEANPFTEFLRSLRDDFAKNYSVAGMAYHGALQADIEAAAASLNADTVSISRAASIMVAMGAAVGRKGFTKKVDLNQTGSYTNYHASGKTYVGKGSRKRSQVSGRREAKRNDDPHTATDWTSAENHREAFKQESRRLDAEGGPSSPTNYNRMEQPGKKYRQQDGEF